MQPCKWIITKKDNGFLHQDIIVCYFCGNENQLLCGQQQKIKRKNVNINILCQSCHQNINITGKNIKKQCSFKGKCDGYCKRHHNSLQKIKNTGKVKDENFIKGHNCSICLEEIKEAKHCYQTSCQHYFHQQCIKEWFKTFKNNKSPKCPLCRCQQKKFLRNNVDNKKIKIYNNNHQDEIDEEFEILLQIAIQESLN